MAYIEPRRGPGGHRVWRAQVRRRGYRPQSCTFDTKAQAEAWAATIESEIARGVFIDRSQSDATTLLDLLIQYEQEVTPSKRGEAQ